MFAHLLVRDGGGAEVNHLQVSKLESWTRQSGKLTFDNEYPYMMLGKKYSTIHKKTQQIMLFCHSFCTLDIIQVKP